MGGILLEHSMGLDGHSDADVLIHAICDALLGAANLRDIGYHFPDTSTAFKDANGKELLKETIALLQKEGYRVGNIDTTVCARTFKPSHTCHAGKTVGADGYCSRRRINQSDHLEKMGFVGREEGITAYAVALIEKIGSHGMLQLVKAVQAIRIRCSLSFCI